VCQQLGQPRGCLIGWVKVAAYLPGTDAVVLHVLLPTYVRSRASAQLPRARARARAEMRRRERGMKREEFHEIARQPPFSRSGELLRFVTRKPATVIGSLEEPVDLETRFSKPEFGISARYESVDNARNSLVMRLVRSREKTRVRGIALEATLFLNHSLSFCQIARRYPARWNARRSRFALTNQLARFAALPPPPPPPPRPSSSHRFLANERADLAIRAQSDKYS